jgi:hypothetical protein
MGNRAIKAVILNLLTARQLDTAPEVAGVLSRLCACEEFVPQKCGVYGMMNVPFDPAKIDQYAELISSGAEFHWRRKKPRAEGTITPGRPHRHAQLDVQVADSSLTSPLVRFLLKEAAELEADIGEVDPHWVGQDGTNNSIYERKTTTISEEAFDNMGCRYGKRMLWYSLPQLQWGTLFGAPYVRLFGRDKLLSAPAAVVEQLGPELVYLQLTPKITDVTDDLPGYFTLRRRVKDHIGADAFFHPRIGRGPYRAPTFALEPPPGFGEPPGTIDGYQVVRWIGGDVVVETPEGEKLLKKSIPREDAARMKADAMSRIEAASTRLREINADPI